MCSGRPVGQLKVAVVKGRGLISSDLNLPGNAYVRVTYVPQRYVVCLVFLAREFTDGKVGS